MVQYSVENDIVSHSVDLEKLTSEISNANCTSGQLSLILSGDVLSIYYGAILDQNALDALVHNHSAITLDDNKAAKIIEIDKHTDAIIAQGFGYDSNRFSLSIEAQMNWSGLYTFQSIFSWPMGVTTLDNTTYELAQANLIPFIVTASTVIATAIGSGRALKIAVNAAADQAALDAVVDSR